MSAKSNNQGRAFEYACVCALKNRIENVRPVQIDSVSILAAKRAWNLQNVSEQTVLYQASSAFMNTLFEAEPCILEKNDPDDILYLSINKDEAAKRGDVRDIVIRRNSIDWDIGLSLKHNHFAVKHSRLSKHIDFGKDWYGVPCSEIYWKEIGPIFSELEKLKRKGVLWKNLAQKKNEFVYGPIMDSFVNEVNRAYRKNRAITKNLISYLLGIRDFYKVVGIDDLKLTRIQAFNLRGELNRSGRKTAAAILIPKASLPTEIVRLRIKPNSKNTAELYLNNGWQLSFRIHNASTIVEPSLKFDIQLLGVPSSVLVINCQWR